MRHVWASPWVKMPLLPRQRSCLSLMDVFTCDWPMGEVGRLMTANSIHMIQSSPEAFGRRSDLAPARQIRSQRYNLVAVCQHGHPAGARGPGLGLEPPGGFPPPAHPMGDAAARAAPMAPPVGPPPPAPGLPQHVPCGGFGQLGLGALGTGEEHRAIPTRIADWPDRFDRAPGPPGPGPVGPVGPAGHLFS